MAQITSSIGLISGINTGDLINQLISLDSAPVQLLQTQVAAAQAHEKAYSTLETQLNNIQQVGNTLALPQTFQNATTNSSNSNVLTATASVGAAVGSYQLQVDRLVTTQQTISTGFVDPTTALVGAGTITLEAGGGEASSQTLLSQLNGGAGIQRGQFRITDRSGNSAVIDTTSDVTLDDVVKQINTAPGIAVHASITDQGLVITDQSGSTSHALTLQDLSGGTSAAGLGIAGTASGNTLTGSDINFLSSSTALSQLNDGNGISTTTAGQNDFTITVSDGTQINVSLNGSNTLNDVINAINAAGGTKLKATLGTNSTGLTLTDTSGGSGSFTVAAQNSSPAAAELGLTATASGNVINGAPLIAGLDSVLVSSLKGGSGISLGTISITDRAGHTDNNLNLFGATSVSDIINLINNNTAGVQVTASLNSSGTGIQLTDTSGGSGNLVISDVNSTTAASLGIAGTFSTNTITGVNLQRQYVSATSQLGTYNAGNSVGTGQFKITNSAGISTTIDLSQGSFNTLGDVIKAINSKAINVTASINANGNGLLLTDTAGGTGKLTVTDVVGTSATNLNIAGTATGTTIDGALEKTLTVTSSDTLTTLQNKLNQLGFGVTANIINDGSPTDPFRLSLTAINSGKAGRVLIDGGTTNLNFANLVTAQDAAVFFGGDGNSQPLLVTSNTNQLTNVIRGVTVNLASASSAPVTLSVTNDPSNVETQLQNFVTAFNSLVSGIDSASQFNTTTNTGGILLGDGLTQQIQQSLYNTVNTVVQGAGQFRDLADIGITVSTDGSTNSPTLSFDQNKFAAAFADDPTAVQNLFSQANTGLGNAMAKAMQNLTDPVNGSITLETNSIDTQIQTFNNQITELNTILAEKRQQLQNQFNNMESTLANLQSQQALLSSLNGTLASLKSSSSGSSSSSSSGSSSSSSSSSGSSSSSSG